MRGFAIGWGLRQPAIARSEADISAIFLCLYLDLAILKSLQLCCLRDSRGETPLHVKEGGRLIRIDGSQEVQIFSKETCER